ncbi:MAG TPA: T9SS type A sorting domain-containing protein, partial [Chitinophagaceae bacterium]|nr:T9SS type A sorting domain-containing protein [Chitinophagaceae bacterium]
ATPISIRIKNLDDAAVLGFTIKYSVDGGPWVTENLPGATIAPASTYTHNFSTTQDFSAPGSHLLRVGVENLMTDPVSSNDTLVATIRQLNNNPVVLTSYFNDDIEIAPQIELTENKIGLEGIDRYDFSRTSPFGRLRTFVNSGISHSGSRAFTLDASLDYGPGNTNYLDGTFNMGAYDAQVQNLRLDFQFKNHGQQANTANRVWIRGNDSSPWLEVYDLYNGQAAPGLFKRSTSVELSRFLSNNAQDFSTSFQVRWGQNGTAQTTDNEGGAGYTFDDIRLYEVFNDIQLVSIDTPQIINCGLNANTPIIITVRNTNNNTLTNIPVQFSVDGGSYITENISSINANTTIQYSFAARANLSSIGAHRVITVVSYPGDSFRDNDTTVVDIMNLPMITSFPYLQNFESGQGSWYTTGKNNSWEYGTPASPKINRAASGSKAWKTSLAGYYNDGEASFLYSPCFDLSGMVNPTLSLSLAMDIEDCGPFLCDAAWVEYSNDGISWSRLGATGEGTNWYNKNYGGQYVWSQQDYTRWHVASIALPTSNNNRLRVRVVFASDGGLPKEGIAIDDIHIYENLNGIYDGPTMLAPVVQQALGGSNWVDFVSGGKLVASVLPNNRSLGRTGAQAYINIGNARNYNGQYYHNRNITIKPGDLAPGDSVSVRFYFLDSEIESLINASGCNICSKPNTAYDLGISKYSDPDDLQEDGIVANSSGPYWSFIPPSQVFKIPFDKGYYAEFKVKDFSEFWLNDGGINHDHALPVQLTSFSASKTANSKDVLVAWTTAAEFNVDHFEIELARGNEAYNQNSFVKIGEVIAGNQPTGQSYSFDDLEADKSGVRYYRLKIIDKSGSFAYSQIRPVVFTSGIDWQVYPNPSPSVFNLMYQLNEDEKLDLRLFDITGRLLYRSTENANGFLQKKVLDFGSEGFAPGLYLLEAKTGEKRQVFRLVRQ